MTSRETWTMGLLLCSALLFAGCAREAGPVRTVAYFRAHPKTLQAVWQRCANDPGELAKTPDCVNARQAEVVNGIGSFRDLPPMTFPGQPAAKSGAPGAAAKSPRSR